MSRITGSDAKKMFEAYAAVYANQEQEITEEQVWEEVEEWVNELVEEGYDLSDYTWEEMYETYFQLDEIAPAIAAGVAASPYVLPAIGAATYGLKGLMDRRKVKNTPDEERWLKTGSFASEKKPLEAKPKPKPSSTPTPTAAERKQKALERLRQRQPSTPSQPSKPAQPSSGTSATPPPGKPPKGPNPLKQAASAFVQGAKPVLKGALTTAGKLAAGTGVAAAADELLTKGAGRTLTRKSLEFTRQAGPALRGERPQAQSSQPSQTSSSEKWYEKVKKESYDEISLSQETLLEQDPTIVYAPQGSKPGAAVLGPDKKVKKWQELDPNDPQVKAKKAQYEKIKATQATQQRTGLGVVKGGGKSGYTVSTSDKPKAGETDQQWQARRSEALKLADKLNKGEGLGKYKKPSTATPPPSPSPAPAAPKPAAPVLSKLGGVEGTGVGKDFKAKAWSDVERQRYGSAAKVSPTKPTGSAMSQWATANKPMIQKVGTPQQKDILKSVESGGKTPMPSVRPISKDIEDIRAMRTASQLRQQGAPVTSSDIKNVSMEKPKPIKASYEYDAYDLVLEYLIDNGHAETIDEAHYIMLEMDAQMVGDIVEAKYGTKKGRKKLAKKIRKGEEVGKTGPGTGFAAVEKAAKKGGARDPKAVAAAAMWKTYGK